VFKNPSNSHPARSQSLGQKGVSDWRPALSAYPWARGVDFLHRNGRSKLISWSLTVIARLAHVLWVWIIRGLVWAARTIGWTVLRVISRVENCLLAPICLLLWRRTNKQQLVSPLGSARFEIDSLGLEPHQLKLLKSRARTEPRVEIGEFDQDGFLLSEFGPIEGIPGIAKEHFVRRNRFSVRLVLLGNSVGVEKDFRGVKSSFVREVVALRRLSAARCRVPALLDIDVKRCRLTTSFIQGKVLREELAKAGAVLRDRDVVGHQEYHGLCAEALRLRRIEAGRKILHQVASQNLADKLYQMLQDIHSVGMTPMNIKYGNILVDEASGEPWLIDFDGASPMIRWGKFLFSLLRDHDTEQFNLHFGTRHLTYSLIKRLLKEIDEHCAVYVGQGLSLGKPWRAGACHGLWLDFIKRNLPTLEGKRFLNLDASNRFHTLELLRSGARQGVAIENDANRVKQVQFLKEAFEWADNRRYDLDCIQMDMVDLETRDFGRFDVVFASDSLDPKVLKHISTITQFLVWKSSVPWDFGRNKSGTDKAALLDHPRRLLQENGFRVCAFSGQTFGSQRFFIAEPA